MGLLSIDKVTSKINRSIVPQKCQVNLVTELHSLKGPVKGFRSAGSLVIQAHNDITAMKACPGGTVNR